MEEGECPAGRKVGMPKRKVTPENTEYTPKPLPKWEKPYPDASMWKLELENESTGKWVLYLVQRKTYVTYEIWHRGRFLFEGDAGKNMSSAKRNVKDILYRHVSEIMGNCASLCRMYDLSGMEK